VASDKLQAANLRVGAVFPTGTLVPNFPLLPREIVERYPQLKDWQRDVKRWTEELTTVLRNTR